MKNFALWLISLYQTKISPKKGYRCAHGVLDGTNIGCSGFAKQAIQQHGLLKGLRMLPARFHACGAAARQLKGLPPVRMSRQSGTIDCTSAGDCCPADANLADVGCGCFADMWDAYFCERAVRERADQDVAPKAKAYSRARSPAQTSARHNRQNATSDKTTPKQPSSHRRHDSVDTANRD